MSPYEIAYLQTETAILVGQAFMDAVTIIFAITVTGYVVGPRLSKSLIWAMFAISAAFVVPIANMVFSLIGRAIDLGGALTTNQLEAMPFLATFANFTGPMGQELSRWMFVLSLLAAYTGAIYFVFYCRRKRLDQANA